jgi:hypothetical protein
MKRVLLTLLLLSLPVAAQSSREAPDWSAAEKVLGRAGKVQDGVFRVGFARTDIHARIGRTPLQPAAALGSWAAFRASGSGVVADGDLVLLEPEVNPVITVLQEHGFLVTALHNHLTGERPRVMYLHFFARGALLPIAETLKAALALTGTPAKPAPQSAAVITYGQKTIEGIQGKQGTTTGSVLSFSFPHAFVIRMHDEQMSPAMGMATAINFQPAPAGVAATGDFVLREKDVNPVIGELRKGGVVVTAVHNHMLDDEPRMIFVHFWAEGPAEAVAKTLRAALDKAD